MTAFTEFVDPNSAPGNGFGSSVVALSTGNVVITSPFDDAGGTNAGAVYLFNGATGALISTLTGSHSNDFVGFQGVTAVGDGNFVVRSTSWDNGTATNAGAATWGSGTLGVSGVVSAANSLIGSKSNDNVGSGVTVLTNGNYVVRNSSWDNGTVTDVGAATWGSGTAGVSGLVSVDNSLIGSSPGDQVSGSGVAILKNGNYVVSTTSWDNSGVVNVGAVTWGNGTAGVTGSISVANSLIGSIANDHIGNNGVIGLASGNYVVLTPNWDNGSVVNAGSVAWGNGTTGLTGVMSAANSLVGSSEGDNVGTGITQLANGNYVVRSIGWDLSPAKQNVGAVTWVNGATGLSGAVSAANSLIGNSTNDSVGNSFVTALTNGNYVVASPGWDSPTTQDVGAVTWANGTASMVGVVSAANSLTGSSFNDRIGQEGLTALSNGNYVVTSTGWNRETVTDAGAVTWGNGTSGTTGAVSVSNSLVGSTASDFVGKGGVTALNNGNYVVVNRDWDNETIVDAGAVTWGSGTTGVYGIINAANSLVGTVANDRVGSAAAVGLTNGNYVVFSTSWNNGTGAATWGNGLTGVVGAIDSLNSLIGTTANIQISPIIVPLSNGNYVVGSRFWDNGTETDAGAATWGDGTTGVSGTISTANSLVGSIANDSVGSSILALSNGNYILRSSVWDNDVAVDAGAATWGNGSGGTSGAVSVSNSLVGLTSNSGLQSIVVDLVNGTFYAPFSSEGGGRVRIGSLIGPNTAPTNVTVSNSFVSENAENGTIIGQLDAADPDPLEAFTFTLIDAADGRFGVSGSDLVVASGNLLDYEMNTSHQITVRATDTAGNLFDKTLTITVNDSNEAPFFTSADSFDVFENSTAVTTLAAIDPESASLTYAISGGADALKFSVHSVTGALAFQTAPNFEVPTDDNGDNVYLVTVSVDDGFNPAVTQDISVTVTNVSETTFTFTAGVLSVLGSDSLDDILSVFNDAGIVKILDDVTIIDTAIPIASVTTVSISGVGGHDTLRLDSSLGSAVSGTLVGGEGNDILVSGLGKDTMSGGNGIDTASYIQATVGVKVSLALTTAQNTVGAGSDTLAGVENLAGSYLNDTLTGSTGANELHGGLGNDTLTGGSGADSLNGGDGNDSLKFDHFDTSVFGGPGTDVATVSGTTAAVSLNLTEKLIETVSATTSAFNNTFDATGATWVVSITGGSGNDTIIGGNMNDILSGGLGVDLLIGNAGNDTLTGGSGADSLDGGDGNDNLKFDELDTSVIGGPGTDIATVTGATAAVSFNLVSSQTETVSSTTSAFNNTFDATGATWVVSITGGSGNDTIIGGNMNDTLSGGPGDDLLIGNAGNDTLTGSAGADSLNGDSGNDTLNFDNFDTSVSGGSGVDRATVSGASAAVSLNLAANQIETVSATTSTFNNLFDATGATWVVSITGGSGNDTIIGGNMNDTLTGGSGDDLLIGNGGNDKLTGGIGSDTVSYVTATAAVNVNLATKKATGGAGADTLATIENIIGSIFDDTLIGDALDNILDGGDGVDTIDGGGGSDTILNP